MDNEQVSTPEKTSRRSFMWAAYAVLAIALAVISAVALSKHIARGSEDNEPDDRVSEATEAAPTPTPVQRTAAPTEAQPSSALETPVAGETPSPFVKTAVVIDGQQSLVLASRQAAESLMDSVSNYFQSLDIIPPNAVTELSNSVELVQAEPEAQTTDYDTAFDYYTGASTPLKYVSHVTFYQDNVIEHVDSTVFTDSLPQGYRLVKVYGMDGIKRITYASTYINGRRKEIIEREQFVVYPAVDGEVLIGTKVYPLDSLPTINYGEKPVMPYGMSILTPVSGTVARFFGMNGDEFNHGIDIACAAGSEVYSSCAGTVVSVMERGSYGLTVEIDHGEGVTTRYAHLAVAGVAPGDRVSAGVVIGTVADSVYYPHLHFELRLRGYSYNPLKVISDRNRLDLSYGIRG